MSTSESVSPRETAAFTSIDMAVLLVILVILLGALLPWVYRTGGYSARMESKHNLKLMGLAVFGIGDNPNNKLPPAYGTYQGRTGSIFLHIKPWIEADSAWKEETTESFIKVYFAPLDASNPGVTPGLTSYASNSTVFTGNVSFPQCFRVKSSSNAIIFVERYAMTGADSKHPWAGENTSLDIGLMNATRCSVEFETEAANATDLAAHAFVRNGCYVAMGDGSVRDMGREINTVLGQFDQNGVKTFTVFNWAGDPVGATAAIQAPPQW